MRMLWICLLLVGCSSEYMKAVGDGFRAAGATSSEQVYQAQDGPPDRPARNTDYACMSDCTKRYSWAYCQDRCSY
jgi:hypothetical protein